MTDPMTEGSRILTWSLVLEGEQIDLSAWWIAFREQPEANVMREPTIDGSFQYTLRSTRFDHLEDAREVRAIGEDLIVRMYGAIKLQSDAAPVKFSGSACAHRADGKRDFHMFAEAGKYRLRGATVELVGPGPRPRSQEENIIELSESDNNVADALQHYARSDDWFDIYKVLEVIIGDVGNKDLLIGKPWAIGIPVNLLKWTANYYRHARATRPPDPVAHSDARDFVRRLMCGWIEEKRVQVEK